MLHDCTVKASAIHGKGVFATTLIPQGGLVWELDKYLALSLEDLLEKPAYIRDLFYFDGDAFILALDGSQYVNHSCNPNTGWLTDTITIATRDIQPDEEITFDYATVEIDPRQRGNWRCRCGDPACRHIISAEDHLNPVFIERHQGLLPSWTTRSIEQARQLMGISGS